VYKNRRTIHIEWGDCDPAGIVYFPRYAEWFDVCTTSMLASAGFPKSELMRTRGIVFPVVDTQTRFLLASRFGEEIAVETSVVRLGRSSFVVQHQLLKGDHLAVECTETRVWTRIEPFAGPTLKSESIPDDVRKILTAEC
jgi:4-hydroxybenzoyl-CoA thioesterase